MGVTHELVGLLNDNDAVTVVAEPHGGMGTRSAATDDDDVALDALATALDGGGCHCCCKAAKAHTNTHDVLHL
jgi:hypothetical protein